MFAGPAPSTGYHFIGADGALNDDYINTSDNFSLVFPLNRITSVSYSIETQRTNISHLGNLGTLKRPILEHTDVNLNFTYFLMGLCNEARLGFYMNIPSGDPLLGPFMYGSGRVCPILGFYSRDFSRTDDISGFNWPLQYRDARNIFVAVRKDNFDFNNFTGVIDNTGYYYSDDIYVYGFGDCYLNSYNCSVGVNQLPNVSVNYTCNNVEIYSHGSGQDTPSINSINQNINSGRKFSIPSTFQGSGLPTVLLPSDISLSIKQRSNSSEDLTDNFVDFTDIKIQSLNFGFNLNRKPLYALGYKYPLDRIPTFPITCDLDFDCIVGDPKAGSMVSLLKRDDEYDITIKLSYQQKDGSFQGTAIQYDFIGAKFKNFDSNVSINQRENARFGFTNELNPNDTTKGFFISGYLSLLSFNLNEILLSLSSFIPSVEYLLTENSEKFLLSARKTRLIY